MENDYIENLRVIAGVRGNMISQQCLLILMEKYHLTDGEMAKMKEYCNLHGIIIDNEEDNVDSDDVIEVAKQRGSENLSEEEKIRLNKVKIITKHIMRLASVKARKSVQGRGWLCGTYTGNVRKTVERYVMRKFDESEMNYIIEHLPVENDEDTCFMMKDADDPQRIIHYNDELNRMIPRLYINRFYQD